MSIHGYSSTFPSSDVWGTRGVYETPLIHPRQGGFFGRLVVYPLITASWTSTIWVRDEREPGSRVKAPLFLRGTSRGESSFGGVVSRGHLTVNMGIADSGLFLLSCRI